MPFTLFHHGLVIGETDFEFKPLKPSQRAGVFRPTQYGLTVLPLVTGMLAASMALTQLAKQRGLQRRATKPEAVLDLLGNTAEGQLFIECAKAIEQLELRDPSGQGLTVESIAISDLHELMTIAASRDGRAIEEPRPGAPRYVISATTRGESAGESSAWSRRIVARWRARPRR